MIIDLKDEIYDNKKKKEVWNSILDKAKKIRVYLSSETTHYNGAIKSYYEKGN